MLIGVLVPENLIQPASDETALTLQQEWTDDTGMDSSCARMGNEILIKI